MGREEDVLKSLGFTVASGGPSLLHTIKDSQAEIINKGFARGEQVGRQGMDTARSRLDGTLSQNQYTQRNLSKSFGLRKGDDSDYAKEDDNQDNFGAKYAKQDNSMHGDHAEMEEGHDKAEVVDSVHGADEEENMAVKIGKKVRTASGQLSTPMKIDRKKTTAGDGLHRSMSQDELFLKALDGIGKDTEDRKSADCSSEKLSMKAKKGKLVDWAKEEEAEPEHKKMNKAKDPCWEGYKKVPGKKTFSDGSCVKKSANPVEEMVDSLIEIVADPNDPEVIANVHENSNFGQRRVEPTVVKSRKRAISSVPFLKSAGPGGFVFDFGMTTGNPLADNATILLNQNADPAQRQVAEDQRRSMDHALTGFVQKGEAAFSGNGNSGAGVNEAWANQMNKPMDQQVQEAFDSGALTGSERGAHVNPKFAKSTGTVNGESVVAMSETDAAVLEMFKAEQAAMNTDTGFIADAMNGGAQRVTIDASTGSVE